jgi:hypothetical protein
LADALDIDHGALSRKLSNDKDVQQDFTLRQLDALAAYLEVPPAALLQTESSQLWELSRDEMVLVRMYREWPVDVREFVLGLISYFAGLSPMERELRRFYSKYRRLRRGDREYVERTIEELLRVARSDARRQAAGEAGQAVGEAKGSAARPSRPK